MLVQTVMEKRRMRLTGERIQLTPRTVAGYLWVISSSMKVIKMDSESGRWHLNSGSPERFQKNICLR